MKTVVIASLLALSFATGFTCSKNKPAEAPAPTQEQMAAPTETTMAPPADGAAAPAPEGQPAPANP